MEKTKSFESIQRIKNDVRSLKYNDSIALKGILNRAELVITKNFGSSDKYNAQLKAIEFVPLLSGFFDSYDQQTWENSKRKLENLMTVVQEDIELSNISSPQKLIENSKTNHAINKNIFVVHGHNEEMKQSIARTIEKLGLIPVILHEQANQGKTIIEKFSDHSNVSFAIVLLSADDIGFSKSERSENGKFRSRQNVILELGFFLGKLGRQKVFALYEQNDRFEFPSDYSGVIFTLYDKEGRWKFDLIRELKMCDFNVDANKIV